VRGARDTLYGRARAWAARRTLDLGVAGGHALGRLALADEAQQALVLSLLRLKRILLLRSLGRERLANLRDGVSASAGGVAQRHGSGGSGYTWRA
jgi:hypothetical protein